jgi:hypothetical protein
MRNSASAFAALLACLLAFACKPGKSDGETNIAALRSEVVREIREQKILGGKTGRLALPDNLQNASAGGMVYVSADPNLGSTVIFVNNNESQDSAERGCLYCERAIPRETPQVQAAGFSWRLDRAATPEIWMVTRIP